MYFAVTVAVLAGDLNTAMRRGCIAVRTLGKSLNEGCMALPTGVNCNLRGRHS